MTPLPWPRARFVRWWPLRARAALACLALALGFRLPAVHAGSSGVAGWITSWDFERGLARVRSAPGLVEDVFLFVAELAPDGTPVLALPAAGLPAALRDLRADGARTWLTVVNDVRESPGKGPLLKDAATSHRLLSDPTARAAHRRALASLTLAHGFDGLDVDYENLAPEDRAVFTQFVQELAQDLASKRLQLSVTVQPKRQESRSVGPGAADWAQLCRAAGRLQVMLYNLHSSKSGPGPLATNTWVREVLGYATTQCDPERVVPVLKLAGMDWGPKGVRDVLHGDALALARSHGARLLRHADGGSPYFTYTAADGPHTVYFEDAESILDKLGALERLGFERVVFWSLGREDPQILAQLAVRRLPASGLLPAPAQKPSWPPASSPHPR